MMNKTEQMLFALLRSSLHEREAELSFFQEATADDWKQCHQIAVAQGVMALAWDGVLRLPKELQPPISLKLSDTEANRLADTLMEQQGIEVDHHSYKHSNFYYKGIPIENYKSFLNTKDIKEAVKANEILSRELNPRMVELTEGKVQIPSPAFNALFIAFHALQHYGCGIALHHLCDWAVILKHNGWSIPEEIKSKRFLEGVKALTCLCNRYLGTSVPVDGGEGIAKEMMEEILNPPFASVVPVQSKIGIILYKTRRLLHSHHLKSSVFDISLERRIWDSIWAHLRRPETIFMRGDK